MRENAQGDDAERAKASEHRCRPEITKNRFVSSKRFL